jgi:hypothetical protein
LTRTQAQFTHTLPFLDASSEHAAVAFPLGQGWVVGMSGLYGSVLPFRRIDAQGREAGTVEIYDMVWTGTAAMEAAEGLAAGGSVKYYLSHLAAYEARGMAFDLGILYRVLSGRTRLFLGASVTNLGAPVRYIEDTDPLPGRMRLGAGYGSWERNGSRHLFGIDAEVPLVRGEDRLLDLGYEWWLIPSFFLRTGYRVGTPTGNISFGFGAAISEWRMDYAYVPFGSIGETHQFSVLRNLQ